MGLHLVLNVLECSFPRLAPRIAQMSLSAASASGNQNAIPPARALQIEAATGIPRATLRPDLWSEPYRAA